MESKRGKFWALRVGLEVKEGGLVVRTLPQVMAVDIDAGNGLVHQRRVNGVCLSSKHRLDVAALVLECIRMNLTCGGTILSALVALVLHIPKGFTHARADTVSIESNVMRIDRGVD